ncbi:MAG: hypothetical protein M0P71_01065 [Melioribacteraceae bacterium]|nr:hypothetical protein [Melioribacteraceae bacterium]
MKIKLIIKSIYEESKDGIPFIAFIAILASVLIICALIAHYFKYGVVLIVSIPVLCFLYMIIHEAICYFKRVRVIYKRKLYETYKKENEDNQVEKEWKSTRNKNNVTFELKNKMD